MQQRERYFDASKAVLGAILDTQRYMIQPKIRILATK